MSHECPECYMTCYCNGDIDDCCNHLPDYVDKCTLCDEEFGEDYFDGMPTDKEYREELGD